MGWQLLIPGLSRRIAESETVGNPILTAMIGNHANGLLAQYDVMLLDAWTNRVLDVSAVIQMLCIWVVKEIPTEKDPVALERLLNDA